LTVDHKNQHIAALERNIDLRPDLICELHIHIRPDTASINDLKGSAPQGASGDNPVAGNTWHVMHNGYLPSG
jgi:hypothetical protein